MGQHDDQAEDHDRYDAMMAIRAQSGSANQSRMEAMAATATAASKGSGMRHAAGGIRHVASGKWQMTIGRRRGKARGKCKRKQGLTSIKNKAKIEF